MRHLLLVITLILGTAFTLSARGPMYVVNGTIVESIDHIAQEDIERIDHLPADDETIAKWGLEASEGATTPPRSFAQALSTTSQPTLLRVYAGARRWMLHVSRYASLSIRRAEPR